MYAQEKTVKEDEKLEQLRSQRQALRSKELELKLLEDAYEQAIDPETYIVGPGDYFSLVIWGIVETGFQVPVSPEGMLVIPTIGVLEVDGLTLKETKMLIKNKAQKNYKKTIVSTILMSVRKIKVHVTGEILDPGTFVATPLDRVSDLIYRAGGLKQYSDAQNIMIKHNNNDEEIINFSEYIEKGDLEHNPLVKGGDRIIVPNMDYSDRVVRVEGSVEKPGFYPLLPDENVVDFLNRYDLLDASQNFTNIRLHRSEEDVIVVDLTDPEIDQTVLKNGDNIVLTVNISIVYVMGAVLKPGPLDFVENLKVRDYVGMAGVNENAGNLNNVRVRHAATGRVEKGIHTKIYPGDLIEVPIRNSKRFSEYLQIAGQLATLIIAYFAITK